MPEEKSARILIVDRQLTTLSSLDSLLSRLGYRVTTCCSPSQALEAVAGHKFDLVVAGRVGPERDGAALISRLKAISPETSVLLLVEPGDECVVADAITAGADGLLRRSYSDSQMIQRVERLIHAVQA